MSELSVVPGPREVDVFRPHRLRIVMCQESRVLVATFPRPLEPHRKPRMEAGPLRSHQTAVGDLSSERVLDRELALSGDRRARPVPDEVALLEHAKVWLDVLQQLADGTGPEGAADHGGCLQRRFLGRLEQVDTGGENRLHRVGNDEVVGKIASCPATVHSLEHALVDQRANELLDEEGIAFRPLDDDLANRGR